eukprot:gene1176-15536_t
MANDDIFLAAMTLYNHDIIEKEEFLLLVAESKETASVFPYWRYPRYLLCCVNEDECLSDFRFEKNDPPRLVNVVRIPDRIIPQDLTGSSNGE